MHNMQDFDKTLLKAASKVQGLPQEAVYVIPEIESLFISYGFRTSKESEQAFKIDNDIEFEIEAKARDLEDDEETSFVGTVLTTLSTVLSVTTGSLLNGIIGTYAKGFMKFGFIALKLLQARTAIVIVTSFIGIIWNALKIAVKAIPKILKFAISLAMKHPIAAGILAAAGVTATGVVAYKYFSQSEEERRANFEKAKAHLRGKDLLDSDIYEETSYSGELPESSEYDAIIFNQDKTLSNLAYESYLSVAPDAIPGEFNAKSEIYETMKKEGWDKLDTSSPDNYSKFGINFNKNRSKEFIRNLTAEQAYDIYKKEYWDASNVEDLPPHLRRMYFNTAVNLGVKRAKELYERSDGTLEGLATERWNYYSNLAKSNPIRYGKYLRGWRRRLLQEYNESLASIEKNKYKANSTNSPTVAATSKKNKIKPESMFSTGKSIYAFG